MRRYRRCQCDSGGISEITDKRILQRCGAAKSCGVPTASTRPACISEIRSQRSASFMSGWTEKSSRPRRATDRSKCARNCRAQSDRPQRSARPGSAAPDCRARRQRAADADGCRAADCQDGHRRRPASRTATASRPPASLVRKRANSRAGREGRGSAGRSARYRARSSVTYTRHCAASRCRWPPSAGRKA